jgi:hypothetical protein
MIKLMIAVSVSLLSTMLFAHDFEEMLNSPITYDKSVIFDYPKGKQFPDPECKRRANKKAVYSINYKKVNGTYKILVKDINGKEEGERHLACIYSQKQSIKYKAGKNVRSFKLQFFKDKEKTKKGCPVGNQARCDSLRNVFKSHRIFEGRQLIGKDVEEYFYNIVINPSNGLTCVTTEMNEENRRKDSCVLDPKIKIVR